MTHPATRRARRRRRGGARTRRVGGVSLRGAVTAGLAALGAAQQPVLDVWQRPDGVDLAADPYAELSRPAPRFFPSAAPPAAAAPAPPPAQWYSQALAPLAPAAPEAHEDGAERARAEREASLVSRTARSRARLSPALLNLDWWLRQPVAHGLAPAMLDYPPLDPSRRASLQRFLRRDGPEPDRVLRQCLRVAYGDDAAFNARTLEYQRMWETTVARDDEAPEQVAARLFAERDWAAPEYVDAEPHLLAIGNCAAWVAHVMSVSVEGAAGAVNAARARAGARRFAAVMATAAARTAFASHPEQHDASAADAADMQALVEQVTAPVDLDAWVRTPPEEQGVTWALQSSRTTHLLLNYLAGVDGLEGECVMQADDVVRAEFGGAFERLRLYVGGAEAALRRCRAQGKRFLSVPLALSIAGAGAHANMLRFDLSELDALRVEHFEPHGQTTLYDAPALDAALRAWAAGQARTVVFRSSLADGGLPLQTLEAYVPPGAGALQPGALTRAEFDKEAATQGYCAYWSAYYGAWRAQHPGTDAAAFTDAHAHATAGELRALIRSFAVHAENAVRLAARRRVAPVALDDDGGRTFDVDGTIGELIFEATQGARLPWERVKELVADAAVLLREPAEPGRFWEVLETKLLFESARAVGHATPPKPDAGANARPSDWFSWAKRGGGRRSRRSTRRRRAD
jgi:hypothetical protein